MASDIAPVCSGTTVGFLQTLPQNYMETHVTGQPVLGEIRHALSAMFFGNSLFSPQEQLLANHYIHECEDAQQLTCWLRSLSAAIAHQRSAGLSSAPLLAGYVV